MTEQYEGIVNPPIDTLLEKVDSKYALVLFAAKRARQINAYYSQLHEGLFEYVGPLVDTKLNEKPLSISMREIEEDLLEATPMTEEQLAAEAQGDFAPFELAGSAETDFSEDAFSAEGVGLDAVAEIADTETAMSTDSADLADLADPTDGEAAEDQQA
ncbi:DNA-directed RNA polymerase subunit omega [Citricoccus sp. I39-566]|uniref:DNA-directed RNA polymerase subunit omega n=1 Tax=Citricoccus sp. I39-566 TaxID=3073268 RepID=UPI00286A23E1|nr:DNA-directed RNA polymerase subunit omega [Citricoccus sp. I39-566]WMY77490.1 DNA-directed RNA polymerase subunit omega [Citricoccus sp. I39-566]